MDRRRFVSALAAAAGTAAVARPAAALTASPLAPFPVDPPSGGKTIPATNIAIQSSYPPIAPLGSDVFERRLDRARQLTRDAGGTVLFATSGATNFAYLVGNDFGRSERLIALVLPVDGPATLVAPAFEVERVKRGAKVGTVTGWEEYESPFVLVQKVLGGAATSARFVVEPKTDYWSAMALQRVMPDARLIDGSKVFETLRVIKTPEEIERMKRATQITEDAVAATMDRLEAGMLDVDVAKMVAEEHAKRGITGGGLVQFAQDSALPHGHPTSAKLAPGMVVLIDAGGNFQGYESDITRTRWFGDEAPAKFREVYNLVHDAQTAAMEKVKPGVPCEEIDRAARAVITKGGYGQYFTHRLGHGIGMDGHEPAYMVEGNTQPLQPGFVFSVEPGIYMLGQFGVRLEDDYMCTETGGALLSRRAPRL